jgi:hypothetical protein
MQDGDAEPCVRGVRFGVGGGVTRATVDGVGIGVMTGDAGAVEATVGADARGDGAASR